MIQILWKRYHFYTLSVSTLFLSPKLWHLGDQSRGQRECKRLDTTTTPAPAPYNTTLCRVKLLKRTGLMTTQTLSSNSQHLKLVHQVWLLLKFINMSQHFVLWWSFDNSDHRKCVGQFKMSAPSTQILEPILGWLELREVLNNLTMFPIIWEILVQFNEPWNLLWLDGNFLLVNISCDIYF